MTSQGQAWKGTESESDVVRPCIPIITSRSRYVAVTLLLSIMLSSGVMHGCTATLVRFFLLSFRDWLRRRASHLLCRHRSID